MPRWTLRPYFAASELDPAGTRAFVRHPFGQDAELCTAQQTILHDAEHASHVVLHIVPAA